MVVYSPHSGFLSISTASSSEQAITPHQYNTHSFRIGGATSAAGVGTSQATIQQLGRWHSQAYQHYIRPPHKAPVLCKPTVTTGSTSASSTSTGIDSRPHCRWQHQWYTCPQQDRNKGSSSQAHTHFILCFSVKQKHSSPGR